MKRVQLGVWLTGLLSLICSNANASLPEYTLVESGDIPQVKPGKAVRLIISSRIMDEKMTADVWFPKSYDDGSADRHPVIYAHDGQNLFDPSLCFAGVAWELDMAASVVELNNAVRAPIIVGIHNRGARNMRANDYFPEKALSYMSDDDLVSSNIRETCAAGFFGDRHAAFVATELKPLVDSLWRTRPDPGNTFAMGSSMGALASLYLLCEYPDVFGGAACLSTHWIGSLKMNSDYSLEDDPACAAALLAYMDASLPAPGNRKLYLDQGTADWDAAYSGYETQARKIADRHGYSADMATLMTYDAVGAGHNEWYWQQRADRPLKFLLASATGAVGEISADNMSHRQTIYDIAGRRLKGITSPGIYIIRHSKILVNKID